jgi:hypothetical protein
MRSSLLTALLLTGHIAIGQVHIDRPLELSAADEALRHITGLRFAVEADEAVNVGTVRSGLFAIAEPLSTSWTLTVPALAEPPTTGTSLNVLFPDAVPGDLSIFINGSGPYPILVDHVNVLDGADLEPGTILALVFNGSAFQVMNHRVREVSDCPVNDQFCVDIALAPDAMDFFSAADHCGARGARLCSWAEFMSSCVERVELGLAMIGQYEWVGSACNENGLARISGLSGCTSTACAFATGDLDRNFRCCTER